MAEENNELDVLGAPELPAPVKAPEYYPGFTQEWERLSTELSQHHIRLQKAEQSMSELASRTAVPEGWLGTIISALRWPHGGDLIYPGALEEAQAAFDFAAQQFQMAEWKLEMMQVMPIYLSDPHYDIQKAEDIINYIKPGFELSAEDTAWLQSMFRNLGHLTNVLPEGFEGDVLEAQSKVINEILTAPKLELKGVHRLTVDEIAKSFAFSVAEMPPGMTEEDVRNLLSRVDLDDEEMKSQREWLAERARDWEIESARMSLIRAGTILAETPELTPKEWLKMTVTQPMMGTVELMQKWWDATSRPISAALMMHLPAPVAGVAHGVPLGFVAGGMIGAAWGAFGGPIGMGVGALIGAIAGGIGGAAWFGIMEEDTDKELTKHYEFYRSQGDSAWASYAKAFNAWEAPWYKKMILDSAYDPLFWIGWGGATAAGRKLMTTALPRGLRTAGTRIGALMVSWEQGYMAGADMVFKGALQVVAAPIKSAFWLTGAGYTIPKTFTQMARNFARKGLMDFKSVLERTFPYTKNMRGLTAKNISETAEATIRTAMANPMDGNNLAVRAGANLLEFNYLDDLVAAKFVKEAAGDVVFDTSRLARFNSNLLDAFSGQGERITAGRMLGDLGVVATDDMIDNLAAGIVKFKESVAQKAIDAIKGDTADKMLLSIFNRLETTRYGNLHSALTKHMQQAGRSASWHSRVADKILYSAQLVALERRVVIPIAKHQLLFFNFGPYNYAENMMRSALGGAEIMHPRRYSGISETNRLFQGLSNAPYELRMFEKGQVRTVQAIIDPKTGLTTVFKGGRIPFITKDVFIPDKVPFLGGKKVGARITIGGKKFDIASATDVYDMWSHLGSNQMAYDYQVHYLKALANADPKTMEAIADIIEVKTKHLLDDIPSISKADATDIRRLLRNEATVGPDAIRAHADIDVLDFQRRQISIELNKTFDKMTDIHRVTKEVIRDEVLDGSMFVKGTDSIDDRIVAHIASERELNIASLANQIDALQVETKAFIANPPKNLDDFLGDMQSITGHIESVGERIHDFRRITELRKALLDPADFDNFEVGSAKMLAEFMDVSDTELTKMMNQLMDNAHALRRGVAVDWDKVTFDKALRDLGYDKRVADMVEDLPIDMQIGLKEVRVHPHPDKTIKAWYNPETKSIWFSDIKHINKPTLYHELSHHHLDSMFGAGKIDEANELLVNFANELKAHHVIDIADDKIARIFQSKTFQSSYEEFRSLHEHFAGYFDTWLTSPGKQAKWAREFFDIRFPRKISQALDETQLARLADLDSITRLEFQNILATRTKIADIEAIIPITPKKLRTVDFWTQQRSQKALIWDEFDFTARKLKGMRLGASRNFLTSVDKPAYIPDFVPDVVGELTPNHLCYLYGVTGDDLYRGLTRVQRHVTVRPREDFILHTKEQASAYASKFGKTAEQLGFTDEAIGEVYEQMWRNLGINPSILTPDHPTVLQLEEVRQELYRLHGSTKIPEADVVKWQKYINTVSNQIERKLPQYRSGLQLAPGETMMYHQTSAAGAVMETGFKVGGVGGATGYGARFQMPGVYLKSSPSMVRPDIIGGEQLVVKARIKNPLTFKTFNDFAKWQKKMGIPMAKLNWFELSITEGKAMTAELSDALAMQHAATLKLLREQGYDAVTILKDRVPGTYGRGAKYLETTIVIDPDNVSPIGKMTGQDDIILELNKLNKEYNELAEYSAKVAGEEPVRGRIYGGDPDVNKMALNIDAKVRRLRTKLGKTELIMDPDDLTAPTKWWDTKEVAMTKARDMHSMAYPTYDDANIIDEAMRAIFPFWNYELFRWKWIPRTFMRTPGTMSALARYMEYTDQGYVPVPGTDLQLNILRGTVWMGGLRSFYLRDFPEYHDAVPGIEFLDYIGRAGFFPGVHVMLPVVLFGAGGKPPEFGQLAPAWVKTGLSGLRTLSPEHIGAVLEYIYPDRFRDYLTMLTLGSMGYDADEIWKKKQQDIKLTEEEEKLWLQAVNKVDGIKGILMNQTGLFRIRPDEFTQIRREMRLAIEEATGVPIKTQEWIDKTYPVTGKRFSDYFHLDVQQQALLYQWESYRRYQGVITPMYPSSWQSLDIKISDYYHELDKVFTEARYHGRYEDGELTQHSIVDINRQFVEGTIGPSQWKSLRNDVQDGLAEAAYILGESPAYVDVPKTFEERALLLEERGIVTPTQTPDQELLYYYFELKPELKYSWESDRMELDFETYYAYIDILLESLSPAHRERLLQRIHNDWTPMEILYWEFSRNYAKPYRNIRDIVMKGYTPEEIKQIRRFEVATGAEREELLLVLASDGDKLISSFQRKVREARQRLRLLDSELDAWLCFFGTTDKLLSNEAKEIHQKLQEQYLVESMIGELK